MNTRPLQVFGNRLEFVHDSNRRFSASVGRSIQTVIHMIVDQRSLGFADGFFDGVKLLGKIEARPAFIEHLDDATEVTFSPLQPFDDVWMGVMRVVVCHDEYDIPPGGI